MLNVSAASANLQFWPEEGRPGPEISQPTPHFMLALLFQQLSKCCFRELFLTVDLQTYRFLKNEHIYQNAVTLMCCCSMKPPVKPPRPQQESAGLIMAPMVPVVVKQQFKGSIPPLLHLRATSAQLLGCMKPNMAQRVPLTALTRPNGARKDGPRVCWKSFHPSTSGCISFGYRPTDLEVTCSAA